MRRMLQGHDSKRTWREVSELAEKEVKPDLASLVADIAREECRKLYEAACRFGRRTSSTLQEA
jgi:hypothetical protein